MFLFHIYSFNGFPANLTVSICFQDLSFLYEHHPLLSGRNWPKWKIRLLTKILQVKESQKICKLITWFNPIFGRKKNHFRNKRDIAVVGSGRWLWYGDHHCETALVHQVSVRWDQFRPSGAGLGGRAGMEAIWRSSSASSHSLLILAASRSTQPRDWGLSAGRVPALRRTTSQHWVTPKVSRGTCVTSRLQLGYVR